MGARILVADDSVTIQKVVELTFSKEDFQIVPARSGEEAIRKAREVRPDLMLIDLVMPDGSGYEVCETLRRDPALKDVPIILLTGTFEAFDRNEGARVGANDFVTKPFESQDLISKVKHHLTGRPAPAPPRPAGPPAPAAAPRPGTPAPPPPAAAFERAAPPPPPSMPPRPTSPAPPSPFAPPPGFPFERDAPTPPSSPAAPHEPMAADALSEEKFWELLEHGEAEREPTYVLPEDPSPGLKLGPPVEEKTAAKVPEEPEETGVFTLEESADMVTSLRDMATSLGVPLEPPPAPAASPPPPPAPAEDLTVPLLESLEILPEEELAPPPPAPPRFTAPAAPPRPPAAPSEPVDVDRLTREITDRVARALVQEVSERLAGKIERIVWEVVPDMAEHLITQEIERIRGQAEGPAEQV